ncbi:MAG: hypothetical protein NVSMB1_26030 [Polyangiales bacterium]
MVAAIRESEERYRFLAENIPVQIWTALPDGRLDFVSQQTARQFGLTPRQLLDEGWQNVLHPDDLPLAIEKWTHALRTGETYEVEFRLKLHDGTFACHLARAIAQKTARGEVVRWFGTNTNIDQQREEQRRVNALLEEVARQSVETEAALSRLQQANARAEARIAELESALRARS